MFSAETTSNIFIPNPSNNPINSIRYLFDIRKFYLFSKVHPVGAQLTMSHYRLLFPLNDDNEIDYYINQIIKNIPLSFKLQLFADDDSSMFNSRMPSFVSN